MTARSIGLGVALSAFVLIGFGQHAFAAGPEYCQRYASNAVQAQLRNIQYRCGFTGRAWSTDYGDHFRLVRSGPLGGSGARGESAASAVEGL
jgi:hypothetical protein